MNLLMLFSIVMTLLVLWCTWEVIWGKGNYSDKCRFLVLSIFMVPIVILSWILYFQ